MTEAIRIPGRARGTCKSCHAGIIWAETERGKWIPRKPDLEMFSKQLDLFSPRAAVPA